MLEDEKFPNLNSTNEAGLYKHHKEAGHGGPWLVGNLIQNDTPLYDFSKIKTIDGSPLKITVRENGEQLILLDGTIVGPRLSVPRIKEALEFKTPLLKQDGEMAGVIIPYLKAVSNDPTQCSYYKSKVIILNANQFTQIESLVNADNNPHT